MSAEDRRVRGSPVYSRVKVRFHWVRQELQGETGDEQNSCWVRVSQAWAGQDWGTINIPRVGQEVIVDFLEGDPDRPIITGRVYNAEQTIPRHEDAVPAGFAYLVLSENSIRLKSSHFPRVEAEQSTQPLAPEDHAAVNNVIGRAASGYARSLHRAQPPDVGKLQGPRPASADEFWPQVALGSTTWGIFVGTSEIPATGEVLAGDLTQHRHLIG